MGNATRNETAEAGQESRLAAENEDLRARVARLEYRLELVHLKDYSFAPEAMRVDGEADCIVQGLPLVDAVHYPDALDPEASTKPYAAMCMCGYTVRTETLEDAQALVRPHEQEVHSEFLTHWPHLSGEVTA